MEMGASCMVYSMMSTTLCLQGGSTDYLATLMHDAKNAPNMVRPRLVSFFSCCLQPVLVRFSFVP